MNTNKYYGLVCGFLAVATSLYAWTAIVEYKAQTKEAMKKEMSQVFPVLKEQHAVFVQEIEVQHVMETPPTLHVLHASAGAQVASEIHVTEKPKDPEPVEEVAVPIAEPPEQPVEVIEPDEEEVHELDLWELERMWSIAIPSLSIRAPVLLPSMDHWVSRSWGMLEEQMQIGLNNGAVAYPHSAAPGTDGNLIIAGHSSPPDEASAESSYGHLFSTLPTIAIGEEIHVGSAVYRVEDKFVVPPSETSILAQQDDESILKLITCYPVGTTKDRMIITAKKVEE